MRKLTLNVPEREKIEINGEVFEIFMTDIDILNRSAELQLKYNDVKKDDAQSVKSAINDIIALIDGILGDGAGYKISRGNPVSAKVAIEWLTAICTEINSIGEDYITEKYE